MANGKPGAPKGNKNGKVHRLFRDALKRALARAHGSVGKGLDAVCDHIVREATGGDRLAAEMIAERIEGKPVQAIEATFTHDTVNLENSTGLAATLSGSLEKRTEPGDKPSDSSVH